VSVTCWSRGNARRRLVAAARPPGSGRQVVACQGDEAAVDEVLLRRDQGAQRVWAASGGQCGKYLAVSMWIQLDGLERHHELVFGADRHSPVVRAELLAMSAASIDRYLAPAKATDQVRGVSMTKPSPLLRSAIKIRNSPLQQAEPAKPPSLRTPRGGSDRPDVRR
jgi:hypothetical protein